MNALVGSELNPGSGGKRWHHNQEWSESRATNRRSGDGMPEVGSTKLSSVRPWKTYGPTKWTPSPSPRHSERSNSRSVKTCRSGRSDRPGLARSLTVERNWTVLDDVRQRMGDAP